MDDKNIKLVENIIESTIKKIEVVYMNSQNYNMPKIAHVNIEEIVLSSKKAFDDIQKTIKGDKNE